MAAASSSMSPGGTGAPVHRGPPLLILDDLIRARALDDEQVPLLSFPKSDHGVTDYKHFCGKDLDSIIDLATKYYITQGLEPVSKYQSLGDTVAGLIIREELSKEQMRRSAGPYRLHLHYIFLCSFTSRVHNTLSFSTSRA